MALSTATITFNVEDMTGVKFDARRTKVWLTTNVENDTVIDKGAKKIRLGSGNITINPDGTGSAQVWIPGPDANPRTWQTTFHVDYPDRNRREQRVQRHFGPFAITGSADLANLVDEQAVPPTYITQVTQQLDAKVAQATSSVAGATAAAVAAAAQAQAAAQAAESVVITDLGTTDAQSAALIRANGSQTSAALSASIASPALKASATAPAASLPYVNVLDFGAEPDSDTADNAPAINAAITAASSAAAFSKSVAVLLPGRRFRIRTPIEPKSNVTLYSPSGTTVELAPTASASMVRNAGVTTGNTLPPQLVNVSLINITFDGNRRAGDSRSPASHHGIFLKNIVGLTLNNVTMRYPLAFGALIDTCADVYVHQYRVQADQINQDGIHFFDCERVTIDGIHGEAGDDLLGISAQYADTRDFTVSNVIGTSHGGSIIRLNQTDRSVTAGETRTLERMSFSQLVGIGTNNKGFSINDVHSSSTVQHIDLDQAIFVGTARNGIDIVRAKKSSFRATLINCGTGIGVTTQVFLQPFRAIRLDESVVEVHVDGVPSDGFDGIRIENGTQLVIRPRVTYALTGKTNPQNCVYLGAVTHSRVVDGWTRGGNRGVQVGTSTAGAVSNQVERMNIAGQVGHAIAEGTGTGAALSDANDFRDNVIGLNSTGATSTVSKAGPATRVRRNRGYETEAFGVAVIPAGQTSVAVPHGVKGAPVVTLAGQHAEVAAATYSTTASTITISVPTAVTADRSVAWVAQVA